MDLGIGRLFEMIEEYFGKRTSRVVLALVTLAVCVYSLNVLMDKAIWPLSGAVSYFLTGREFDWTIFKKELTGIENILAVVLSILIAWLMFHIAYRFVMRRLTETQNKTKALIDKVVSVHDASKSNLDNATNILNAAKDHLLPLINIAMARLKEDGEEEKAKELERMRELLLNKEATEQSSPDTEDSQAEGND